MVAVAGAVLATGRTSLACVLRVYLLDPDAGSFGLVDDELLQLVEVPRVDPTPVRPIADAFEVFNSENGVVELPYPVDEAAGGRVIEVTNPAAF